MHRLRPSRHTARRDHTGVGNPPLPTPHQASPTCCRRLCHLREHSRYKVGIPLSYPSVDPHAGFVYGMFLCQAGRKVVPEMLCAVS